MKITELASLPVAELLEIAMLWTLTCRRSLAG
jgi:hypothetical protein